ESIRARADASYARIRLWGSLGFIATAQAFGMLLAARGDRSGDPSMPRVYAACVCGFALAANLVPSAALPSGPKPHLGEVRTLLGDRRLLLLLAAGALHAGTTASYQLL